MHLNTPRMSRAASKQRTRELLLQSARSVFAEKGYNAATVEEIASGAGFTRGAFYANFEDKADCFWSLVEHDEIASFADLSHQVEAAADGEQLGIVEQWFGGLLASPTLTQAFGEILANPQDERSRERLAAIQRSHLDAIVGVLEQQAQAYDLPIRVPIEHLAVAFLAIGGGLMNLSRLQPDLVPTSLFADAMSWLFLGASAQPEPGS